MNMKKFFLEFVSRGMSACGLGPIVLAITYLILQQQNVVETLTVNQVCIGIFSLSALAFIAGGMNVIHQIERLPLMLGILIHGVILYIGYLMTYLINDWLEWGITPIFVFSGIFVLGYLIIWMIIYSVIRKKTEKLNVILKETLWNASEWVGMGASATYSLPSGVLCLITPIEPSAAPIRSQIPLHTTDSSVISIT